MSFTTHIHKADCMFKEGARCWYCKATIKRLHYCAMPLQRQTDLRKSSFRRGPLLSGFKGDEKIWLLLRSHFFFFFFFFFGGGLLLSELYNNKSMIGNMDKPWRKTFLWQSLILTWHVQSFVNLHHWKQIICVNRSCPLYATRIP